MACHEAAQPGEPICEALRSSIARRTGGMLERLSVACLRERIRIEIVCRTYYSIQLVLSAVAAASGESRKRPIDLTARVNGRSLSLHLSPSASPSPHGKTVPAKA